MLISLFSIGSSLGDHTCTCGPAHPWPASHGPAAPQAGGSYPSAAPTQGEQEEEGGGPQRSRSRKEGERERSRGKEKRRREEDHRGAGAEKRERSRGKEKREGAKRGRRGGAERGTSEEEEQRDGGERSRDQVVTFISLSATHFELLNLLKRQPSRLHETFASVSHASV